MQKQVAYVLLLIMLGLIALGLVMLCSTSAVLAATNSSGLYTNLRKQIAWLILGAVGCVFFSRCDYQQVVRFAPWLVTSAAFLLVLCLIPHIGLRINGSPRWLRIGGWTYQPSEFAKLALIVFLAWWMGKYQRYMHEFFRGFLLPLLVALPLVGLVAKEQDLGSTFIMMVILVVMMFCAGTRLVYLAPVPIVGLMGIVLTSLLIPERMGRWMAFLHPEQFKDGKGYQQWQALIALGSGGVSGLGLGNSRQKMYYLPEVNTDFVFPIIGEELGLWVTLTIVLCFLLITLCGGWISLKAPDPMGVLLGTGLVTLISLQALMNLAVVTSLMPCKGLPLPFISYGGSNLLTCLIAMGILFNLYRQGVDDQASKTPSIPSVPFSVRM